MPVDHERRAHPRVSPQQPVYVDYPDRRPRVRDISLSGAYIEETRPLPRGRIFQLRLWLDERTSIAVKAMVRRCDETVGMAVEFLAMSDGDRNRLRNFVGATAKAQCLQSF